MNNLFLLGLIACILSILLITSASAKELHIKLTESLDMKGNDKKPKEKTTKEKLDKTKEKVKKLEKTKTKKAKNPTNMKTKSNTVKNLGNIR